MVYYESIKRELNRRLIYECRCDERLKAKAEGLHVSHTLGARGPPRGRNTKEKEKEKEKRNPPFTDLEDPSMHTLLITFVECCWA